MDASLEERVGMRRQPQEIIIEMLEQLRMQVRLSIGVLSLRTNLQNSKQRRYLDYLMQRGLIGLVREGRNTYISLTEQGKEIPLNPFEFSDFAYGSGRRTKVQVWQDIANAIYMNSGKATQHQLFFAANASYSRFRRDLRQMIAEEYLEKKVSQRRIVYGLTQKGISAFKDPGKRVSETSKQRSKGEILYEILAAAQNGANKTALLHASSSNLSLLNQYIEFLLKYGLLYQADGRFIATDLYRQMWQDALPYALDQILEHERRTNLLMRFDLLSGMQAPILRNDLFYNLEITKGDDGYVRELDWLVGHDYAAEHRYAIGASKQKTFLYQRTAKGDDLVAKVNQNLELLKPSQHQLQHAA